jgi:predicted Zn finger-like uncharacterized protein
MPVVIACPTCQQKVRVNSSLLGKSVKCPQCKNPFTAVDPNAVPESTWEAVTQKPELDFSSPPPQPEAQQEEFDEEEDAVPRMPSPGKSAGSAFVDYLLFRRMITPVVLTVVFYVIMAAMLIGGISYGILSLIWMFRLDFITGLLGLVSAFLGTIFGILFWRIGCELILTLFRILEHVRGLKEQIEHGVKTQEQKPTDEPA